ncbi:HNH endonuclease [Nocardiopsis gilva YIM 90087]|uniref:HNH endonuclease n=1 Tax=Nocardiopsis gilva YIM 90087 TaxID=1235441 RepID=A0A223S136_9ACTN|nr:HNH endonuclease [Nocardiopsis gilva]ASU81824.1 HNH endonuclease [Nocardiopsis gilva YIM 90087]
MDWVERIAGIKRWSRGGYRAPHKPLLILYALGRFQAEGDAPIPYRAAEGHLKRLLDEFGPSTATTPAYPFHHLTNDGLWMVDTAYHHGSPGPYVTRLRESDARGRLTPELVVALREDPQLLARIARSLLDANFEPSLHADICMLTGLSLEAVEVPPNGAQCAVEPRDPAFREQVLVAYEYRCAFCGYDGWLDNVAVALEAAHVQWWAFDGPDRPDNGLCLCSLHHKLFDKGVLGLTDEHSIAVSAKFVGRASSAQDLVVALSGRPAAEPQAGFPAVELERIDWHCRQVFRGPARQAAAA